MLRIWDVGFVGYWRCGILEMRDVEDVRYWGFGMFNETSLPYKKAFYSKLNSEDITDKDYAHAQEVFKELKLKSLSHYHDLYVQSDTLLFADVFENFRNKCIINFKLQM